MEPCLRRNVELIFYPEGVGHLQSGPLDQFQREDQGVPGRSAVVLEDILEENLQGNGHDAVLLRKGNLLFQDDLFAMSDFLQLQVIMGKGELFGQANPVEFLFFRGYIGRSRPDG